MIRLIRNLALVLFVTIVLAPLPAVAGATVSCDSEQFNCSRKQWDFSGCTDSCTALLSQCITNCGDAPASWQCDPPGPYSPPDKKEGWCYCYTGPCIPE